MHGIFGPITHARHSNFPKSLHRISPQSALGNAGCAERNGHGDGSSVRLVDRASTVSSYGMGAAYQGSNSPEPAADTRILGRLVLSEGAKSSRVEHPLGSFARG